MTKFKTISAFLVLTATAVTTATAGAGSPVTGSLGDWRTPLGSIIRVEPCGSAICLRVIKISPSAPAVVDINNPDPNLRNRSLCNAIIGSGFTQADNNRLGYGHLYDPISGHTYRGYIMPNGNTLKLRGYVFFTIFGRTENWSRVPTTSPGCH